MKSLLTCVALALMTILCLTVFATSGKGFKGATDQDIINASKASWEAYKTRNVNAIKAITTSEYASNSLTGPSNLQQDIATIDKLTIESYSIDEPKVSWVTKEVAILRYKCALKGSYDGQAFKPVYVTEVWVNRGGNWRITSYSETPLS